MKNIALLPLLLSTPIQNTIALPAQVEINCNQNIIYNTPNYDKVIRKQEINTGMGYVEVIQLEYFGQENDRFGQRQQDTLIYINLNISSTDFNLDISNYWSGSDEEKAAEWQVDIGEYKGNSVDSGATSILNATNQQLINNFFTYTNAIENYATDYYNDYYWHITDSQGETDIADMENHTNISPQKMYYFISNSIVTQQDEQYTNPYRLQNGYFETKLQTNYTVIIDESNYEVIDIAGLMWQILSMPFTFISTAFNFTFFANTPYEINVANILFTVIGALMIIWIIRKFTK